MRVLFLCCFEVCKARLLPSSPLSPFCEQARARVLRPCLPLLLNKPFFVLAVSFNVLVATLSCAGLLPALTWPMSVTSLLNGSCRLTAGSTQANCHAADAQMLFCASCQER